MQHSGIVTLVRFGQYEKAPDPTYVTLFGIDILVSAEQPENAE